MAFFPHAYKQVFVLPINSQFKETGTSDELVYGHYGFFNAHTWKAIPTTDASVVSHGGVIFTMASPHSTDKIGVHGGFQESIKSKPIDAGLVRRFYKVAGRSIRQSGTDFGGRYNVAGTTPSFERGKQYLLRIDIKGSPALRYFTRHMYKVFDAQVGTCVDKCVAPCPGGIQRVDPTMLYFQWAAQINNDPVFSQFLNAKVWYYRNGTTNTLADPQTYVEVTDQSAIPNVKSYVRLANMYADTRFNNCSFLMSDFFETEGTKVTVCLVDEEGNPCTVPSFFVSNNNEMPPAGQGLPGTILKDLILSNRYRQEHFQEDPRRREIENGDATTFDLVSQYSLYDSYFISYSVPRHSNPTSTLDDDDYLLQLVVPSATNMNAFIAWFHAYLASAGNPVRLENM